MKSLLIKYYLIIFKLFYHFLTLKIDLLSVIKIKSRFNTLTKFFFLVLKYKFLEKPNNVLDLQSIVNELKFDNFLF